MIGEAEATSGIITANTTFTAATKSSAKRIDFTVQETIGSTTTEVTYYPVFESVPTGVTFYSSDGQTTYDSMNANIAYAMVEGSAQIQTVRSVNYVS